MLKLVVIFTGFVTWKEFHVHFLLAKGYKQNDTLQHVEDYESLSIEPEGEHLLSVTFAAICVPYFLYQKMHFTISCTVSVSHLTLESSAVAEKSVAEWMPLLTTYELS